MPVDFVLRRRGPGTIAWIPTGKAPKRPQLGWLAAHARRRSAMSGTGSPARPSCRRWSTRRAAGSPAPTKLEHPPRRPSGPGDLGLGHEWADPGRIDRIAEVLTAGAKTSVEDSARLQTDVFSNTALRAAALLRGLTSADPQVERALQLLEGWDGHETKDSAAATPSPRRWLEQAPGASDCAPDHYRGRGQDRRLRLALQARRPTCHDPRPRSLGDDPAPARSEILLASLSSTLDELAGILRPRHGRLALGRPAPRLADPAGGRPRRPRPARDDEPRPPAAARLGLDRLGLDLSNGEFAAMCRAPFRMVVDVGRLGQPSSGHQHARPVRRSGQPYRRPLCSGREPNTSPLLWSRKAKCGQRQRPSVFELTPAGQRSSHPRRRGGSTLCLAGLPGPVSINTWTMRSARPHRQAGPAPGLRNLGDRCARRRISPRLAGRHRRALAARPPPAGRRLSKREVEADAQLGSSPGMAGTIGAPGSAASSPRRSPAARSR